MECNGGQLLCLWLVSPALWLPAAGISSEPYTSSTSVGLPLSLPELKYYWFNYGCLGLYHLTQLVSCTVMDSSIRSLLFTESNCSSLHLLYWSIWSRMLSWTTSVFYLCCVYLVSSRQLLCIVYAFKLRCDILLLVGIHGLSSARYCYWNCCWAAWLVNHNVLWCVCVCVCWRSELAVITSLTIISVGTSWLACRASCECIIILTCQSKSFGSFSSAELEGQLLCSSENLQTTIAFTVCAIWCVNQHSSKESFMH